jgi:hypothetical protein
VSECRAHSDDLRAKLAAELFCLASWRKEAEMLAECETSLRARLDKAIAALRTAPTLTYYDAQVQRVHDTWEMRVREVLAEHEANNESTTGDGVNAVCRRESSGELDRGAEKTPRLSPISPVVEPTRDELIAALRDYATHVRGCPDEWGGVCDCGFAEVLARIDVADAQGGG